MKYNDIVSSVLAQFLAPNGFRTVPYLVGQPGGGKSACAREIASVLAEKFGIDESRVVEFNPSLRDPVDLLGVPVMRDTHAEWLPPSEFYAIRAGQGPAILILEELSDAGMNMQNPLCRVILDRYAGQLKLSEELYIIATGNRTEDRSGANRLSTKLGNRLRTLKFDVDLDDWVTWACKHGIPAELIGFIRFRPQCFCEFDPARTVNPTPRSWEDVGRIPRDALSEPIFFEHVAGCVGEGAASEYVGFLKTFERLPNIDDILSDPEHTDVPQEADVLYAISAKLGSIATKQNFPAILTYVSRMYDEFAIMTVRDVLRRAPSLASCKECAKFMLDHSDVFLGEY